jgi:hypothetical protein
MDANASIPSQLEYKIKTDFSHPDLVRLEKVVVKNGPQAYKVAMLRVFGNKDTGEVKRKEFRAQTYLARKAGGGYDFTKAEQTWHCEDDEIIRLQALLNEQLVESGTYQLFKDNSLPLEVIRSIQHGVVPPDTLSQLVQAAAGVPGFSEALADSNEGQLLVSAVRLHQQRKGLSEVRQVVETPTSTEPAIQKKLEGNWWIFGGRFVAKAVRRNITVLDQLDIPLIRGDGALHVVELKRANISDLVILHRNHYIVGPEVHKAVGQGINYLRALDEQRAQILADLGIDVRRASVTVVIGHTKYVKDVASAAVEETIRSYNSHLVRVEVITYEELISSAERALLLGS